MTNQLQILNQFQPVGLDELKNVQFMNRLDTKYLFSVSKLQNLLDNTASYYHILEINGHRKFNYKTVYFDTPELLFLYQHLTGKLSRYKVRVRTYDSNGLTFLEVKHKTNKGRTSKTRILNDESASGDEQRRKDFLNSLLSSNALSIKPMITTAFTRITVSSPDATERITIDFNLSFKDFRGNLKELPFLAIAEIKRDKSHGHSVFVQQLKKMGLHQSSFSKYCVGMALLNDIPKKNTLKPKLLLLNKIKDEYDRNGIA